MIKAIKKLSPSMFLVSILFAGGCGGVIKQEVVKLDGPIPRKICIIEHNAVKLGVLEAVQEGLNNYSIPYQTVPGTYVRRNGSWFPQWPSNKVTECDTLLFYNADWGWDFTVYMTLAEVWMTTVDGKEKIAQATYDATKGEARLGKFINTKHKMLELIKGLLDGRNKLVTIEQ